MERNLILSPNGTVSLPASINTRSLKESQLISLLKKSGVCIALQVTYLLTKL
jgi:hypothetical protein